MSVTIREIVDRFVSLEEEGNTSGDAGELAALLARVVKKERLNLEKLFAFDDFNFVHDIYGLLDHTDTDGNLTDCFCPRCGTV